jgi:hypothetical protein
MSSILRMIALIGQLSLQRDLAAELDVSVRDKYLELWDAVQVGDPFAE